MSNKNQRKLSNIIVLPDFQGKMIGSIFVGMFLVQLFMAGIFYVYVKDSYGSIFRALQAPDDFIVSRMSDLSSFGLILIGMSLVLTLIIIAWMTLLTHRAAGPIFHFKRIFNEVRAGDMSKRVNLREKDEFKEVADAFNQMMDQLEKRSD